ncbi:uncharacterized protein BYT42DRAFT_555515 [Radiomyces spectabilis]|uniref:uncharacterized protein n=1 Tax=Radiomyces spectabilis TaxID=64574 RepID=UPI00222046B9|nr:uncharacterized protein BYT42DRAFT_555515 [Radiomyces spectabilis]KAI8391084.1 hypothetical protein BYT42DRAFT_555515 [Radiomyces spectabilis]
MAANRMLKKRRLSSGSESRSSVSSREEGGDERPESSDSEDDREGVSNYYSSATNPVEESGTVPPKGISFRPTTRRQAGTPFLIDGEAPRRKEGLERFETSKNYGPGRRRSTDYKGQLMDFIDQIYPPLVCSVCYQTSTGRADAEQHLKETHKGVKSYSCMHPSCEHAYSSRAGLRYHLEHAHTISIEVNHKFQTISSAKEAKPSSVHSSKKKLPILSAELRAMLDAEYDPLVCPRKDCKERFERKAYMLRHMQSAHPRQFLYTCFFPECTGTKTYSTRNGLIYHLVSIHNGDLPAQQ